MTRQELIKLQRTIGFPQSLLQYLGTFSRDTNRPAQDWPLENGQSRLSGRFDMTNMQLVIPGFRIRPGNNGKGHAWGLQKKALICQLFGFAWVDGTWERGLANRFTDPNYYGHWVYGGSRLQARHQLISRQPGLFPDHQLCHDAREWWRLLLLRQPCSLLERR